MCKLSHIHFHFFTFRLEGVSTATAPPLPHAPVTLDGLGLIAHSFAGNADHWHGDRGVGDESKSESKKFIQVLQENYSP